MGRSDSSRAVRPSDWMPSSFESRMTMRCIVAKKRAPHKREKNPPQSIFFLNPPFSKGKLQRKEREIFTNAIRKDSGFVFPSLKKRGQGRFLDGSCIASQRPRVIS